MQQAHLRFLSWTVGMVVNRLPRTTEAQVVGVVVYHKEGRGWLEVKSVQSGNHGHPLIREVTHVISYKSGLKCDLRAFAETRVVSGAGNKGQVRDHHASFG